MFKDSLLTKIENTDFEKVLNKLGYAYFKNGYYNLNIIGVRRKENRVTNSFDDYIVVIYKTPTKAFVKIAYPITTDPGAFYMKLPANKKGTAILVPGQYRRCWTIGKHKGKYEALVQAAPVKVYRDNNKDDVYDYNPETIDNGIFGINIHKSGESSKHVDKWSAGCQVFKVSNDFRAFMRLCHEQVNNGFGNKFTYTLINEEDLC